MGSSGKAGFNNHYNLLATHTGGQQSLTQNVALRVSLAAVQDPSSSLASSVYTCKVGGWFLVAAGVAFQSGGTSTFTAGIRQNGTVKAQATVPPPSNNFPQAPVSTLLFCAINDTIDLIGASNGTTDLIDTDTKGCFLTIAWFASSS